MELPKDISDYLRKFAPELGDRILQRFPPLQSVEHPKLASTRTIAAEALSSSKAGHHGHRQAWNEDRAGAVDRRMRDWEDPYFSRCAHVHSERKSVRRTRDGSSPIGRKVGARSISNTAASTGFLVDGLRTQTPSACHTGVNEVRLRNGRIIREGLTHQPYGLCACARDIARPATAGFFV